MTFKRQLFSKPAFLAVFKGVFPGASSLHLL